MKILRDDISVFDLLENAGKSDFNPNQPLAMEFEFEGYWCLLLFNPFGISKGCTLFLIEHESLWEEVESELLPQLLYLPDSLYGEGLKNEALACVERIIGARNSSRSFFDAH